MSQRHIKFFDYHKIASESFWRGRSKNNRYISKYFLKDEGDIQLSGKPKEDRNLGGRERNKTLVNCQQLSIRLISVNIKLRR